MAPHLRRLAACLITFGLVAVLATPAGSAQQPPTTPSPPVDPNQPPYSEPPPLPEPGPVHAKVGTAIGMLRVLPKTRKTDTILDDPEWERRLPKQSLAESGMGLAVAEANSSALLSQERAIAEAAPAGVAMDGKVPTLPGSLIQLALPDHERPMTGGVHPSSTSLLDTGALRGSAHARWDYQAGPCRQPIADSRISLNHASVGTLPGLERLGPEKLLAVPETIAAHSTVELEDSSAQQGKSVRSTSTLRINSVLLFPGSPQEVRIDVLSQPTLRAIDTGDPATSSVDYEAPVLRVSHSGQQVAVIDGAHPTFELPTDFGLLHLEIGNLREATVDGHVRAESRLFGLTLLPGDAVGSPAALASMSFGEQIATADAPRGGVICDPAVLPAQAPPDGGQPSTGTPWPDPVAPSITAVSALLFGAALLALRRPTGAHSV